MVVNAIGAVDEEECVELVSVTSNVLDEPFAKFVVDETGEISVEVCSVVSAEVVSSIVVGSALDETTVEEVSSIVNAIGVIVE